MDVPLSFTPSQAAFLQDLSDRLGALEAPQDPKAQCVMASTDLTAASAGTYAYRTVYLSDLNQMAYSNGSHWYKIAVGTLII